MSGLPRRVWLMSQRISVVEEENLHHKDDGDEHGHKAYGVYDEAHQTITLDTDMGHDRRRESFLHEQLHAMFSMAQLDSLLEGNAGHGADEHVVSALAPVILSWLRDNRDVVAYLQEEFI